MDIRFDAILLWLLAMYGVHGVSSNIAKKDISETGYKCKTCKRVVMSIDKFLMKSKTNSLDRDKWTFEEQIQEEFDKLCTYSNVFFDLTHRKSVIFHSKNGEKSVNLLSGLIRAQCEELIENYEDQLIAAVLRHVRLFHACRIVQIGFC
jgi:hypothetical protein